MAPRLVLAFLLVVALTAGCIGGTANPQDPSSAAAPQGAQAGSPSDHGSPERDETAVTATRQGSTWIVRQTITLSNDFGGASHSDITLDTLNGDVTMAAGGNGGYEVVANLFGQGNTEAQARDALDKLRYTDVDSLDGSTLTLTVQVKSTVQQLPQGESHGASFSAKLPPQPSHGLSADSSNGKLTVTGLHGGSVALDSSNGDLTVSGVFAKVVADTSNGAIGLSGTFNAITADTSNGAITATVRSTASGALRFSSSNADIRVTLEAGSDRGFDVSGDTSNGEVTIDLGDAQASDEDDASARSDGYAGKAIKLDVDADTSNADITITAK
ncbi:MAG: hypothetical protein QOJ26_758 [Thermoplasmata archaeon]|nr:hypothetical protein [Thermoplasmata archaeon]